MDQKGNNRNQMAQTLPLTSASDKKLFRSVGGSQTNSNKLFDIPINSGTFDLARRKGANNRSQVVTPVAAQKKLYLRKNALQKLSAKQRSLSRSPSNKNTKDSPYQPRTTEELAQLYSPRVETSQQEMVPYTSDNAAEKVKAENLQKEIEREELMKTFASNNDIIRQIL